MADVFKAMAHPIRRAILKRLKSGACGSGEFADAFDVSWPTVTSHLNALKQANLVTAERDGTRIIYRLNASVLEETALLLLELTAKPETPDNGETQ